MCVFLGNIFLLAEAKDLCTGALSPAVKWLGLETDHSYPISAEVTNGGAVPPLPDMS
jgi:hypothetical protein